MGLGRVSGPSSGSHRSGATWTPSIQSHLSGSSTQLWLLSCSEAPVSETKIHFEDASVSTMSIHSEDSASTPVTAQQRDLCESWNRLCIMIFPYASGVATQAIAITLQLSVQLWIRTDFLAYLSKQPRRDQNCYKICRYAIQTVVDSGKSLCAQSQQPRRTVIDNNEFPCMSKLPKWLWFGDHAIMRIFAIFILTNNSDGYKYNFFSIEKGFASDHHKKPPHTSISFAFSQRGYSFSCPRVFCRHHTSVHDLKDVFFPLCFWQIQSEVSNRMWQKIPTVVFFKLIISKVTCNAPNLAA